MSMVRAHLQPYTVSSVSLWKGTAPPYGTQLNWASQCTARGGLFSLPLGLRAPKNSDQRRAGFELLPFRSRPILSEQTFRRWLGASSSPRTVRSNSSSSVATNSPAVDRLGENWNETSFGETGVVSQEFSSSVALPPAMIPRSLRLTQLSIVEQAFLLLGFIASVTSFALFALVITAIPALNALRKAAVSMEKLAEVAAEELPGTMAAIRLSGMEISDLTLELNDLSQEISDGMKSSARAVRAAEVGIRRMGEAAASQTLAMLHERASVPVEVVKPAVASAAATTLQAVAQAQQIVLGLVSHPRSWLSRKGNQVEKEKPVNGDLTAESESSTAVKSEDMVSQEESSLLLDERDVTLYASSDAYLRPDEADFLLFDVADILQQSLHVMGEILPALLRCFVLRS
ncbi:hypothetical protein R1flu_016313 [Riccia fluitans]|uniref:Uncharacterized protein n=1 Tax=Riccia fluitans TaxID=41844 RepID=A0ABD1YQC8_9MARC